MMNLRQPLPEEHSALRMAGAAAPSEKSPRSATHAEPDIRPVTLFAPKIRGTQTLLQPDAPPDVILPRSTPIPFVMVWSSQFTPVKPTISTPPNQVLAANEQPSETSPNQELTIAQIKLSASPAHTEAPLPMPSTTSPVVASKPEAKPALPLTVSNAIGATAPARIMSLSDIELKDGTITVPLANSLLATSPTDSTSLLRAKAFPPTA